MDLKLKGKVAIVTGAAQGIGRAIALTLADEGCNVVIVDRNESKGLEVKNDIEGKGVGRLVCKADVTNPAECEDVTRITLEQFGKIDILVNNAGYFNLKSFLKMSKEECEREVNTNYYGVINFTRAVLPNLVNQKSGVVLCVSSDAGKIGEAKQPVYSGTKAAINVFMKALAKDYGKFGIRFNTICPSFTTSEGGMAFFDNPDEVITSEKFLAAYPLRKVCTPQDCGDLIAFLASDRSSQITGQNISVDGGFCMA